MVYCNCVKIHQYLLRRSDAYKKYEQTTDWMVPTLLLIYNNAHKVQING